MTDGGDVPPGDISRDADPELAECWRRLMGLVLDQRWRWADVAIELGLTQAGLRALLAVAPDRPSPQRDLAAAMNCDPSYVTAMIDDLERAGYATRQPSTRDRRVKVVALTPTGIAALRTARDGLFATPQQLRRLSRGQQRQLAQLLHDALRDG